MWPAQLRRRRRAGAIRSALTVLLVLTVAACAHQAPPRPAPAEPVASPTPKPLVRRPIPPSGEHVVRPGETLSEIAWIYRLNTLGLARANGIEDVDRVEAGAALWLAWEWPAVVIKPPVRGARYRDGGNGTGTGDVEVARAPAGGDEILRVFIGPARLELPAEADARGGSTALDLTN